MKTLTNQGQNQVKIIGKLLDASFRSGKTKAGVPYESATVTIRVAQSFDGRDEVDEIPVSIFGQQFTSKGQPNPAYKTVQDLHNMKTAQEHGYELADTVRITGANLRENNFVAKSGQVINTWQINSSFINGGGTPELATFFVDIFIMDMSPELNRDGEETGRLLIKGAVVQYGGKLEVFQFIVEDPDKVEYITNHWNVNDTVNARGHIRVTSLEEKSSGKQSTWGEQIPDVTTKMVRELIITDGDDEGKEEDFAYDPVEIKKGFNVRKAMIEQMQVEVKEKPTANAANDYDWR